MSEHVKAVRALTADVGECTGCNDKPDEVTVIGFWPTPSQGTQVRLCDTCLAFTLAESVMASKTKPVRAGLCPTSPSAKPNNDKPQGAIARKAKLKVYGMTDFVPGASGQQRVIVAAKSIAEACRAFDCSRYMFKQWGGETGNAHECNVAMARPGIALHRSLDRYGDGGWATVAATKAGRKMSEPSKPRTPAKKYAAKVPA